MNAADPRSLRKSLDDRLLLMARERGQEANRLRRHLVFQRVLRRLDESWVLKGGYLLETRLGARARATKDLDLALVDSPADISEAFTGAMEIDVDGDGFVFRVTSVRGHAVESEELGGPGSRLSIEARLGGRIFASVRVDVVARAAEIAGGTERMTIPMIVSQPGWEPVAIQAVDLAQHMAEKFHALCAVNAHSRPSTRVKDLLDIVLVMEAGILDESRLADRLNAVFIARDGAPPPPEIPDPPAAWVSEYAGMAADHLVSAQNLAEAMLVARALYTRSRNARPSPKEPQ